MIEEWKSLRKEWKPSSRKHYLVRGTSDHAIVTFQRRRLGAMFTLACIGWGVYAILHAAFRRNWDGNVLAGLVGGAIGIVAVLAFMLVPLSTRWSLEITPDLVTLQRTFSHVPVGRKQLYARSAASDLGFFPRDEIQGRRLITLCLWINGRSTVLERNIFLDEGLALAEDLRSLGIEFPRTYLPYDPLTLLFNLNEDYLSF